MKYYAPILVACLILVLVVGGIRAINTWTDAHQAAWQVESDAKAVLNVQDYQDELRNEVQRRAWWTEFYKVALTGGFVVASSGAAVAIWQIYDKRRESWARAVDGSFALQTFKNTQGQIYVTDPNKATFGVFGFDKASGQLITDAQMVGPDRQLAYSVAVQRTRTAQAQPVDQIRNSAQAKLAAGFYDRPQKALEYDLDDDDEQPAQLTVTPFTPLTTLEAFEQSSATNWILGQSPTTGELFELNPKETVHFGIVGAPGTGKTGYTALMLMVYALRSKYRVIILDGKGGADWSKYSHVTEYFSLDYSNVGALTLQLYQEYEKRQAILNEHGANSIWELPSGVTKPRPTMIIIDEFGRVMDGLKAGKSRAENSAFNLAFGDLLRLSRSAGMYIVLCDQNPSKWPSTARGIVTTNLAYRLGGGVGNGVQEYNLDRLDRVGQFQVSNTVYNAFKTYDVIDQLLPDASYKKPVALLTAIDSTIDSAIAGRGGVIAKTPPPAIHSTINSGAKFTPVIDSTIDSGSDSDDSDDSTINSAPLTGKPLSRKEIELVRNTFALTNRSRKKTVEILYGKWTVSRDSWVKEIVSGEVLQ